MNWTQKIIVLGAMVAIVAYDQIIKQHDLKFYLGISFLVLMAVIGIIITKNKAKNIPEKDRKSKKD